MSLKDMSITLSPMEGLKKLEFLILFLDLFVLLPDRENKRYVFGMDNYFTLPRTLAGCRELVAVVGAARSRRGWPPPKVNNVNNARFNTLYTINDERNFKIMRWIDNIVVLMVSTVHTSDETVRKRRRRPRITTVNRNHIEQVWGPNFEVDIETPRVINDYNHWMLGVDKSDQLFAYYRPALRVRRYWSRMAMMFHGLDIIRVNSYIVHKNKMKDEALTHKNYICGLINALIGRAYDLDHRHTRRTTTPIRQRNSSQKKKMISTKSPTLNDMRRMGQEHEHVYCQSVNKVHRACEYRSYLRAIDLKEGKENPHNIRRPNKICSKCQVHLSGEHKPYHTHR